MVPITICTLGWLIASSGTVISCTLNTFVVNITKFSPVTETLTSETLYYVVTFLFKVLNFNHKIEYTSKAFKPLNIVFVLGNCDDP